MNFERVLNILNRDDLDTLDTEDRLHFAKIEPMIVPFLKNQTIDELIIFFKECRMTHISAENYLDLIPKNLTPSKKTGTLLNEVCSAVRYNHLYDVFRAVDFTVFKTSSKCVNLLMNVNFAISKEERTRCILKLPLKKRIECISKLCTDEYYNDDDHNYRELLDFNIIKNTEVPEDERDCFMTAFFAVDIINYNLFGFDQMSDDEKLKVFRNSALRCNRDDTKINKPLSNELLTRILKERVTITSLSSVYQLPPEVVFEALKSDSEGTSNIFAIFSYRLRLTNTNDFNCILPKEYLPEILKLKSINEGASIYLDAFFKKYDLLGRRDVIEFIINKYTMVRSSTFDMIKKYLDDNLLKALINNENNFNLYGYVGDPKLYLENIPEDDYSKQALLVQLLNNEKIKDYIKDDDNLRRLFELINRPDNINGREILYIIYLRGELSNIPDDIALKINLYL